MGPTNAAMDFDAVALSTLKTPAGFLLSLLFCRSVAHLPAFEKLGGAHESAAMLINRANDLRPNVDLEHFAKRLNRAGIPANRSL